MYLGLHPDVPMVAPLKKSESYFFALKIHLQKMGKLSKNKFSLK